MGVFGWAIPKSWGLFGLDGHGFDYICFMKILIVNGPNLNLLGTREPEVYGTTTFAAYFEQLQQNFKNVTFDCEQSNVEGEIVNFLQAANGKYGGILLNAAAYSHTSIAIADAVAAIQVPVIEVHISNIFAREAFRQHSYLSKYCKGVVVGFGLDSYRLGVLALLG